MKKVLLILALLCVSLQAQTYQFESASGGSTFYWSLTGQAQKTDSLRVIQGTNMTITQSGNTITFNGAAGTGSTANVRANTGWTSNGTTAQDTLATVYRLDKANIRFIVTDADGDTLWFYPQNLHPLILKDGTLLLSGVDSTGRGYFGGNAATAGQTRRALLNIVGVGDTVVAFIGDGNRAPGDSSVLIHADAALQSASRAGFGISTSGQATRATLNVASRAGADTAVVVTSESNYGLGDSTLYVHGNANVQSGARAGFGVNTSGQAARAILNAASRAGGDSLLVLTAESNYGVGDSSIIVHGDAVMQSGARAGFGAATKGQATRAYLNVLRRSGADTLALLIGDGNGAPGDSTMYALVNGQVSLRGAPYSTYTLTVGGNQCITSANYEVGTGGNGSISNTSGGGAITIYGGGAFGGGVDWLLGGGNKTNRAWWYRASSNDTLHTLVGGSTNRGYALSGRYTRPYIHTQAFYTIRPYALSDTLFMVRNDNNATLDSTAMVFANGDGYFGGNNLYLGGHRIRSNAAGDSLIFYDGSTMIFAILSDGSTADLVAGTPLTRRYIPPPDVIWMLRIAIALFLLLIVLKIREHVKLAIRANEI